MIGIVVVSHSPDLAQAAVDLALQMVSGTIPSIAIAAGSGDAVIGTDALRVSEAITSVSSPDGVLVIMDLGSAILSAELALEFVADREIPIRLTSAPFVEGILAGVVMASTGASLGEVEREARGSLSAKQHQLGEDVLSEKSVVLDIDEVCVDETLVNPMGLHLRPAAALVSRVSEFSALVTVSNLSTGKGPMLASSPTAIMSMGGKMGDVLRICARGAEAEAAVLELRHMISSGFGELAASKPSPKSNPPLGDPLGVSPGWAMGPALVWSDWVAEPKDSEKLGRSERTNEVTALRRASESVCSDLLERARLVSGTGREILEATASLANDPLLITEAEGLIESNGLSAARAIWETLNRTARMYIEKGGVLRERAVDLYDVRDRLIADLLGETRFEFPASTAPYVLITKDLAPADAALLDRRQCLALVTEEGGPTSHTAIVARSLGIPAIVCARGATNIPSGTVVLVDGFRGILTVDPSEDEIVTFSRHERKAHTFDGVGRTADGHRVELLSNLATVEGISAALEAKAEGVGLFRTELCFLDRKEPPGVDEQVEIYRAVLAAFPRQRVVIRTLDAGADKPLPFLDSVYEVNPALGVRGYRMAAAHPEIMRQQLHAIACAASAEKAHVSVMAPMINTPFEAAEFKEMCREEGLHTVGVMVETPAAAVMTEALLGQVEFVSLGTNDLAQYTMAADRMVGALASFNDPWQPAVLRMIELACRGGVAAGKRVGVCGEAASDPLLAPVLVGLGASSLSMAPRGIASVSAVLLSVSIRECQDLALRVVAAENPAAARELVRAGISALGELGL